MLKNHVFRTLSYKNNLTKPQKNIHLSKQAEPTGNKTNEFVLYCARLAVYFNNTRCTLAIKTNEFVLYCARLAVYLHSKLR